MTGGQVVFQRGIFWGGDEIGVSNSNVKSSRKIIVKKVRICILCLFFLSGVSSVFAISAFPGAEGFGKNSIGGRGGRVIEVNTLADSGPGSLRAAVTASGPRIVVFRVGGTITLLSQLKISKPYITIAGQTAPGDGICLKDYNFTVAADHVIVRYMRFRLGDNITGNEWDTVTVTSGHNIILDHCSASWSVDEVLSTDVDTNVMGDLTVQWCMITESLNHSVHPKGEHGYGSLVRGCYNNGYSFHHNLYAHHKGRNPRPGNYVYYVTDPYGLIFDFRNNVVYNWGGSYAGNNEDVNTVTRMNFIGNYYVGGPNSTGSYAFRENCKYSRAYFSDNWMNGSCPNDPWSLVWFYGTWTDANKATYKQSSPIPVEPMPTDDAVTAYNLVLADAGASFPARDTADTNVIDDVINGTGSIINCEEDGNFYRPTGYARAGTSTTITLATTASSENNGYNSYKIEILAGTGVGQVRTISAYVGSTRVATVSSWSTIPDTTSEYGIIIDCTNNAGGWPVLASGTPPVDSDHDGMPDEWELAVCLDPNSPSDANTDRDGDGYTNIEEYINWLPLGRSEATTTDLNCDDIVNFEDFSEFANHWSAVYGDALYSGRYDFGHNDVISFDDLYYIAKDWLLAGQEY
jgi:hypothetical protein